LPELPEVETTRNGIAPFLCEQAIESIVIRQNSLRWPVSEQLYSIQNVVVNEVLRRGKYIILCFSKGSILIHLGMSGSLRVVESTKLPEKHDHIDFVLCSGKIIRFNDPRRFGCVLWADKWQDHKLISSLGPEPLTSNFTPTYLFQEAKNKKLAIKQFIMNSKVVVGVGNIYANEALFLAGIHPEKAAGVVSKKKMALLVENIKVVLTKAIEQGGTTLKDFVGSDGKPGYFQQALLVYGRSGKACHQCEGILLEIRQNNRSTVYCKNCQK